MHRSQDLTKLPPGPLKPLKYYLEGIYEVVLSEEYLPQSDTTIYLAKLKSAPRCFAQGATAQQALDRLEHFKETMIKSRHECGVAPPEPDHHRE